MKIVIDIPDEVYEEFKAGRQSMKNDCIISNAVFDGKVLPEGHGRLIDADALIAKVEDLGACNGVSEGAIDNAPTIIE